MRGRGRGKGGVISTDLLACFPRGHLALMPKPVCSPSRAAGGAQPKRLLLPGPLSRFSGAGRAVSNNPRLLRSRTARRKALPAPPPASASTELVSEPTSPKVTCAGQIKVGRQCRMQKSGGSSRQQGRTSWRRRNWLGALGIKREVMHLLAGAVRGLRLNSGCFGRGIPCNADCSSDEDDGDEEEDEEVDHRAPLKEDKVSVEEEASTPAGAALSRWFTAHDHEGSKVRTVPCSATDDGDDAENESPRSTEPAVPPPNALLLMRCRSAPARGRFVDDEEEDDEDEEEYEKTPGRAAAAAEADATKGVGKTAPAEAVRDNDLEKLVLRAYAPDVFRVLSTEVAKETWVAGTGGPDGPDPLLLRCRSWRR